MNEFKEAIKEQAEITFSPELRAVIKSVLLGKRKLLEVCNTDGGKGDIPKDPKTLKRRIEQIAGKEEEYFNLYSNYRQNLSKRPRGYSYIVEILDMLENNLSQREIAEDYSISRDTLKDAIKRIKKVYPDLDVVLKEHAQRHKNGSKQIITEEEMERIKKVIDKYKPEESVDQIISRGNIEELSQNALNQILDMVYELEEKGYTQYEISKELGLGVSTIRRYKAQKQINDDLEKMEQRIEGK